MSANREARFMGMAALTTSLSFASAIFLVWLLAGPSGRGPLGGALPILLGAGFGLVGVAAFAAAGYFRSYFLAARRLAAELELIATVNPAHRAEPTGPRELRSLAGSVNQVAARLWESLADRDEAVAAGKEAVEREKERLAALMAELAQGVLVCSLDGQILLYNRQAEALLSDPGHPEERYVGLGRSLFAAIDRNALLNAIHHLQLRRAEVATPSRFVTTGPRGQVLRATMVPIREGDGRLSGFVLTLEDVTREREAGDRREGLLRELLEGTRRGVAAVRAAIETIQDHPSLSEADLERFRDIIRDESRRLTELVAQVEQVRAATAEPRWELTDVLGEDLLVAVHRRLEDSLSSS
ncbi:MAG: PAS domain-containing protein, partial [Acidimicrobiia bacterium]